MKSADMPAMPFEGGGNNGMQPYSGLTKREMFAMHAMQGILSNSSIKELNSIALSDIAVEFADTLLHRLEE